MTTTNDSDPGVAESGLGVGERWDLWCMDGCGIVAHSVTLAEIPRLGLGHESAHGHRHLETRAHHRPIPDQVLTPLSAEALWGAYDAEFYRWKVSGDGDPDRAREAVEAAIRTPLEAEHERAMDALLAERDELERQLDALAYAVAPVAVIGEHSSANDPWANALAILNERAALAGVPKEAGEAVCECGHEKDAHHYDASGWCFKCHESFMEETGGCLARCAHDFNALAVVAAPVEDANEPG